MATTVDKTKTFKTVGDLKAYLDGLIEQQGMDAATLPLFVTREEDPRDLLVISDISFVDSNLHGLFVQIDV